MGQFSLTILAAAGSNLSGNQHIYEHFQRDNMVVPHHTDTNGGDLRLAIPGEVLGQKRLRNFATMYWQTSKQIVFSRTYLTPDELAVMGFRCARKPVSDAEPLNSEIRLGEEIWRYGARDFFRALEMAKVKFQSPIRNEMKSQITTANLSEHFSRNVFFSNKFINW